MPNSENLDLPCSSRHAVHGDISRPPPGDDQLAEPTPHRPADKRMTLKNLNGVDDDNNSSFSAFCVLVALEGNEALQFAQSLRRIDDRSHRERVRRGRFSGREGRGALPAIPAAR